MRPKFFKTAKDFRDWLEKNHQTVSEQWVGFYKKDSGKPSITRSESIDEALCFGWIDGLGKNIDEVSYKVRFSPRRSNSIWSAVNVRRVAALRAGGRMRPAGERAFESRREYRSGIYSYEQRKDTFDGAYEKRLKANKAAWKFFYAQPPGYRRVAVWFVVSAKKEETRLKRLDQLIDQLASGNPLSNFLTIKSQKAGKGT
jgi:uncharacterized protein YdeI (YjbR/CyaY-like superfamily)